MQPSNNSVKGLTVRYILHFICLVFGFWIGVNLSFSYRLFALKWYQEEIVDEGVSFEEKINWINNVLVEKSMVDNLQKTVNLLCWVMHNNVPERRLAIMDTWGRRCNHIIFVIGDPKAERTVTTARLSGTADLVTLKMIEDYNFLWLKTKLAFKFILEKYKSNFDWVLKIDDDSFVIVENLKLFLKDKDVQSKFYYGFTFKKEIPQGYNSGGSGYVMSMFNVQKLVETFSNTECYQGNDGPEDINVGKCLALVGVFPGDTRDLNGRFRFIMSHINGFLLPGSEFDKAEWFRNHSMYEVKDRYECCSDSAISFHQITSYEIRLMEYMIYYVHPFGNRNIWN